MLGRGVYKNTPNHEVPLRVAAFTTLLFANILSALAGASASEANRACALLPTSFYSETEKVEIRDWCALPMRTRNQLPSHYWFRQKDYQLFLRAQPLAPQAAASEYWQDQKVSALLNQRRACQFYSMISPSVQSGRVVSDTRLRIVMDAEDMLAHCEQLADLMVQGIEPRCSVIELAGHATQPVGLDTVLSFSYPSRSLTTAIGRCLRKVSDQNAGLVTSTCGGERDADGFLHFWRGKQREQQNLSDILGMPILSGIGPVRFASRYGPNGVEAIGGWALTYPRKQLR